ncbi:MULTISPECIES: ImmA/IrrE family metallo-endopeptidase [Lactobacillus]|uniref:ImmA/IrrE family metallo-endopeptidase n=1 Tax=Lactobacillus TaxID=1578 RepID=UPI000CD8AC50|nr:MULTISPECIES: ImmA/IrrE family metallo-endopeptidase [Lactobacillus]RVU74119.1 ImmA/IrrE family metallo-endopeptidase [Lactobacillus xujianguonis]
MDTELKTLIKDLNIKLEFAPLHCPGLLVHGKDGKPNVMIVNSSYNEEQAKNVILHELGHMKHDKDVQGDYVNDDCAHTYCEHGANSYLIRERVKEYFALGNDLQTANWLNLAEYIGTDNYYLVREELSKYRID